MHSLVITFDRIPLSFVSPDSAPLCLTTADERVSLIRRLGVDKVIVLPFDEELRKLTAKQFIKDILVDRLDTRILVIGHDHGFGSDRVRGIENFRRIADEVGIKVIEAPYWGKERVCSSAVREFLTDGNIDGANRLLGRPYSIKGKVIKGRRIGRTIGFPTANIGITETAAVPRRGVYAAVVNVENDNIDRGAMVNIGVAPTVTDKGQLTLEAYILDFDGDLYDHNLNIKFITRLRDEKRFENLDELKKQLEKDLESTRTVVENYVENP